MTYGAFFRNTVWYTLVTDRIFENRTKFHKTLVNVQKCSSRLAMLGQLKELLAKLLNPSLRLQILRGILGLDETCNRKTLVRVMDVAHELVLSMDGTEPVPSSNWVRSLPDGPGFVRQVSDEYHDEFALDATLTCIGND